MSPVPLWLLSKMATEIKKHCACVCPCAYVYLTPVNILVLMLASYVWTSLYQPLSFREYAVAAAGKSCLSNRTLARWRHLTTSTRMLWGKLLYSVFFSFVKNRLCVTQICITKDCSEMHSGRCSQMTSLSYSFVIDLIQMAVAGISPTKQTNPITRKSMSKQPLTCSVWSSLVRAVISVINTFEYVQSIL